MKKKVLKHDLEFVVAMALIAGVVAAFSLQGLSATFSVSVAGMLFIGYMAFSGFKLRKIMSQL